MPTDEQVDRRCDWICYGTIALLLIPLTCLFIAAVFEVEWAENVLLTVGLK